MQTGKEFQIVIFTKTKLLNAQEPLTLINLLRNGSNIRDGATG